MQSAPLVMKIPKASARVVRVAKRELGRLITFANLKLRLDRFRFERSLSRLHLTDCHSYPKGVPGLVLVDGGYDNPNYWFRYILLRLAGSFHLAKEVGLLGQFRRRRVTRTFKRLGIGEVIGDHIDPKPFLEAARSLVQSCRSPEDILTWRLPEDFPGSIIYDGILKRQAGAEVSLSHSKIVEHVAEALAEIQFAIQVMSTEWKLVVLSHAINFHYAALAWVASRNGIPVIVCYGNYGVPRYWRINEPDDIFSTFGKVSPSTIDRLDKGCADSFAAAGRQYITHRLKGSTNDIGAFYAYQKNRINVTKDKLLKDLEWPDNRPVVTVYASNWFDFPHAFGMRLFNDFLDWVRVTLGAAQKNRDVSWLFRAHPCDQYYGGVTLSDLFPEGVSSHIRLCPTHWNGADVLAASDAVVTFHGTVGVEATVMGTPTLVADIGWYHDQGFCRWSRSREEYIVLMSQKWWLELDMQESAVRAAKFAGLFFCVPKWQRSFMLLDDYAQDVSYAHIRNIVNERSQFVEREISLISRWLSSGVDTYHTFKMMAADDVCPPVPLV